MHRSAGAAGGACVREESDAICFGAPYGIVSRFRPTEIELGLPPPPSPADSGSKSTRLAPKKTATLVHFCNSRVRTSATDSATVVFEPTSRSHAPHLAPAPLLRALGHLRTSPRRRAHTLRLPCAAHGHGRVHMCMSNRVVLIATSGTPVAPLHLDCPVTCHSLVDAQPTWMHAPAVQ